MIQSFCHITSCGILGEKIVLCATKKTNILTLVLSGKKIQNETINHSPPPFQVKWSVPKLQPHQLLIGFRDDDF